MFDNSGRKIKSFVNFVFKLNAVVVILAVLGITIFMWSEDGFGAALVSLIVGAIGGGIHLCIIYLGMLCVYAFGEMAQHSIEQTELLKKLCGTGISGEKVKPDYRPDPKPDYRPDPKPDYRPDPKPDYRPEPKPVYRPEPKPDYRPGPKPEHGSVPKMKDGKVICPHCGAKHIAGTTTCKYCGTSIT